MRAALASALVLVLAPSITSADPRSDKLFEEGRALLDQGKAQQACDKFDKAIQIDPTAAGTMLNLGLCNEQLEKYATALYWFRKAQAAAAESKLPEQYEQLAKDHMLKLAGEVATISLSFNGGEAPAGTRVKIDHVDVKPEEYAHVEVDPGRHELDAAAPHMKNVHRELDVPHKPGPGENIDIVFAPGENTITIDRGRTRRHAAIYTAIGGGALLVADGIVALYAYDEYHGGIFGVNDSGCNDGKPEDVDNPKLCDPSTRLWKARHGDPSALATTRNAKDLANHWGTGLFIASAVTIGIAATLYFTAPQPEKMDETVFVPTIDRNGAGFAISGRF